MAAHFFSFIYERIVPQLATQLPGSGVGHSSGAGSPFSDYTAGVVVYVLLTAFLVFVLLFGAFLVLNLGMMSKRAEDRTGKRDPSEVGILKSNIWPPAPFEKAQLPAEEEGADQIDEDFVTQEGERKKIA